MIKILLVGAGGFLGSISRYAAGGLVHRILENPWFPYGTAAVNILGCFIIGFFGGLMESRQFFTPEIRLFLMVGFLGGFTTFSSFGYETITLARDAQLFAAFSNVLIQLILGLGAVWLGLNNSR